MARIVEIRSYRLKTGEAAEFDRLFREEALPMLRRWGVDVVGFGASPGVEDGYFLIRAYADLDDRQRSQDAFYGSDEWRAGPREPIVSRLETLVDTILELDDVTIDGLRRAAPA